MKTFILLPCYNEEKALPLLLNRISDVFEDESSYEVIIINDGSYDETLPIAKQYSKRMPVHIIDHGVNKGLGSAMKNGLQYAATVAAYEDVVVALDADNTHNPTLIKEMINKLKKEDLDIIIASRYAKGGQEIGLSLHRKFLSLGASTILKMFFHIPGVRDYTCGYRAYSAAILKQAHLIYNNALVEELGFVCMAEIIIKLSLIGAKIGEVGLVLRYDQKEGKSKMKIIKTINRYLQLITKSNQIIKSNKALVESASTISRNR
ncbi:glycosyltransferase family 2 protein [Aneurinibacillus terranovensis]|uniref:glycosyltransferase family 2 protein n=1 Tax=Aneurinibacillus terranovensis TaxID=278991 RepID=UPI00040F21A6|nr:glycosyltransferase family 2 protein [Aneurinibacillus terranovensis]